MSEVNRYDIGGMADGGIDVQQFHDGYWVKYVDYAELKADLDALAAENAVMLRLLTDISENHVEYFSEGESGMFAGVPLDYVSEINMYVSRDVNAENPFPTTDALINSVRADELGKVAVLINLSADKKQSEGYDDCARDRRDLAVHFLTMAHQLRAGKDGE
ncbi:hypothetical protein [Pantoea agglomerans]|uniref:hypothetical protein n=1 Tax=Enterobacter agglomerans TaxID=549 RepID=UPI002412FB39|nr:hypothetical protein [Pantoea agglomerans]